MGRRIVIRSGALVPVGAPVPDPCLALGAVSVRQTNRRRAVLSHGPCHPEVYPWGPSHHVSHQVKP